MTDQVHFEANRDLAIFVPDLARAEQFYGEVMGLPLVSRSDEMLHFESGSICLFVLLSPSLTQGFTPSFDVDDAEAARARLIAAGCEPVLEGEGGGHFRDPFGFVFDVMQRD